MSNLSPRASKAVIEASARATDYRHWLARTGSRIIVRPASKAGYAGRRHLQAVVNNVMTWDYEKGWWEAPLSDSRKVYEILREQFNEFQLNISDGARKYLLEVDHE